VRVPLTIKGGAGRGQGGGGGLTHLRAKSLILPHSMPSSVSATAGLNHDL
jgi:hypothetical protein